MEMMMLMTLLSMMTITPIQPMCVLLVRGGHLAGTPALLNGWMKTSPREHSCAIKFLSMHNIQDMKASIHGARKFLSIQHI